MGPTAPLAAKFLPTSLFISSADPSIVPVYSVGTKYKNSAQQLETERVEWGRGRRHPLGGHNKVPLGGDGSEGWVGDGARQSGAFARRGMERDT